MLEVKVILISHISISDVITLLTPTCNFRCSYCFFRPMGCRSYTPSKVADVIIDVMAESDTDTVLIAGGEPTLQSDLPELTEILHRNDLRVILSTNGTRRDVIERCALDEVHVDLKALDDEKHRRLTGSSNREVLRCIEALASSDDFLLEVATVFIPGIVDVDEIEDIASFLSPLNVSYRITGYMEYGNELGAPRPGPELIMEAAEVSRKYLDHVTTSLDFRRHKPRKRIITDLR
ncbi:radical SAM protein [Methanothermobacter sp. THM-1]|nr:radical SAM protein [Methanothermobacter sp. THM-1]